MLVGGLGGLVLVVKVGAGISLLMCALLILW